MIKRIKLYFNMKRTERQMKYEILAMAYSFIADKDKYLAVLREVAETSPSEMKSMFWEKFADLPKNTDRFVGK